MTFRDLSDLELAALAATMHELSLLAGASADYGLAHLLGRAVKSTTREVIARQKAQPAAADHLFDPASAVSFQELRAVRSFVAAGVNGLRRLGFEDAASLLEERLASEIRVDVSEARPGASIELRTIN